ncbi:MAG TPA: SGNH/GDSL hydrolase family protein [Polyangiales bacterium]|nr:SGNH/GDSL hydrolase family protein [Polyangiales bacterium]
MSRTLGHSTRALACRRMVAVASMLALTACTDEGSVGRTTNLETLHVAGSPGEQEQTLALEADTYTQYIALGDSFASGFGLLGAWDWSGTNGCARDLNEAWPPLVHGRLGIATPLVFAACSGATTQDILALGPLVPKTDEERRNWKYQLRPQIEELPPPDQRDTVLITIQVGGNDIKWDSTFAACMDAVKRMQDEQMPEGSIKSCKDVITLLPPECNDLEWLIDNTSEVVNGNLAPSLDYTFRALRAAAPNATIVALGYPHLVDATSACDSNSLVGCVFDAETRQRFNDIADAINAQIANTAASAGILSLTSEVVEAFSSHGACSPDEWISGVTGHPNAAGHRAYAQVVANGVPAAPTRTAATDERAEPPIDPAPPAGDPGEETAAPAAQDPLPEEAPAPQEEEPAPWPEEEQQQPSESE